MSDFAAEYMVNIISGKLTPQIQMFRHDGLNVFACGNDQPWHFWNSLIRQMLLENLLSKDIEEYGVLKIHKEGRRVFKEAKVV